MTPPASDAATDRTLPHHLALLAHLLPPATKEGWMALHRLDEEYARIAQRVREPMLGFIRLAWWKELLEEIVAGGIVRPHPLVPELRPLKPFLTMQAPALWAWHDAQAARLDPPAGLSDEEWRGQARAMEGGRMHLAAQLWAAPAAEGEFWAETGEAWARLWLLVELPMRVARRERWMPVSLLEAVDADSEGKDSVGTHIRAEVARWAEELETWCLHARPMLVLLCPVSRRLAKGTIIVMRHYLRCLRDQRHHPWPPLGHSRIGIPARLLLA